jgi:hypothetical protein
MFGARQFATLIADAVVEGCVTTVLDVVAGAELVVDRFEPDPVVDATVVDGVVVWVPEHAASVNADSSAMLERKLRTFVVWLTPCRRRSSKRPRSS